MQGVHKLPFRSIVTNAEVLKPQVIETKTGKRLMRVSAKTWNPTPKGQDPEEVFFNAVIFNPTDDCLSLKNGDRINIGDAENMMLTRVDTNPNMVMVPKDKRDAEGYPARFPEVVAFGDRVVITKRADTTRSKPAATTAAPAPSYPQTDHDDDLPF